MPQHHVRFAPSPTGDLHLGHIYSALYGWQAANANPQQFHLRIDDLDHTRCRPHFIQRHIDDLNWLGISWAAEPLYQSKRTDRYQSALSYLQEQELIYPCFLTRREVDAILSAPHSSADASGDDKTKREIKAPSLKSAIDDSEAQSRQEAGTVPAWRLDMAKIRKTAPELSWHDAHKGTQHIVWDKMHDTIIARRDIGTSYDLSVVLDDYDTGISLVTRGEDLFQQTHIHRILQHILSLPTPLYDHHPLITDDKGKRLAKRDDAKSLATLRQDGATKADIMALLPL